MGKMGKMSTTFTVEMAFRQAKAIALERPRRDRHGRHGSELDEGAYSEVLI